MRRFATLLLLLAMVLPHAGALAQSPAASGTDQVSLLPGDLVRVQIWKEEDLSGEFVVDQDGVVVFPLIGEQKVMGLPIRRLREDLLEKYRVHLRNPSINIVPLRRVNVLGEVNKPGLYPIDPTVSLAGVVAIAGGASPEGTLDRIRILRSGTVMRERVGAGETVTGADIRSGDEIIVERRPWLERNSPALLTSLLSLVGGVITTLIILNNS